MKSPGAARGNVPRQRVDTKGIPRRTAVCLLVALACLSMVLRYPETPHEIGADSFVFHGMTASIQSTGYAEWTLNPLSYFGLYPLSQPSGGPFLGAATSDLTGLTIEATLLALDSFVALVALLAAFALGMEFFRNSWMAVSFSAVLALTPAILSGLEWQMPTRITFTALLPVFLWTLLRFTRQPTWRNVTILGLAVFTMATFHRLTVLVSLIVLAFVITAVFLAGSRLLRLRNPGVLYRPRILKTAPVAAVVGVLAIAVAVVFFSDVLDQYSAGVLVSGNSVPIELFNLGISLTRSSGVLLPVGLVGIFAVATQHNKDLKDYFMIVAVLSFTPVLFLRDYTGYYTVPFTSILVVAGLFYLGTRIRTGKWKAVTVALASAILLASSAAITSYNVRGIGSMPGTTYSAGLYLEYSDPGTVISNDGLLGSQVHSVSALPYLPIGGATTAFQGPELLIFGFVGGSTVPGRVVPIPLNQLTMSADSPFELPGLQAEADWAMILNSPAGSIPQGLRATYHPTYVIENTLYPTQYVAYGHVYDSVLLTTSQTTRYAIYDNANLIVWQL